MIMSSSIREIRRIYPKANITLLITQFSYSMAECCPYVDKLFIFSERLKKYADFFNYYKNLIEVVRQLLRHKTDIVFSFGQFAGALLLSYMTGAKKL